MMLPIRHYYHCYAAGAWSAPVRDHWAALGRSGLEDMTTVVGLVGPEHDRKMARERITLLSEKWVLPQPSRWAEAAEGHEQVTMSQIHADVHGIPGEYAVLYMHDKGSFRDTDDNAMWRRSVTRRLVGEWERCAELLEDHDIVGCHWMEQFGDWFFAGTFWWARASYLRLLPPPEDEDRWSPEVWVSQGACPARAGDLPFPKIYDMLPGRPVYG